MRVLIAVIAVGACVETGSERASTIDLLDAFDLEHREGTLSLCNVGGSYELHVQRGDERARDACLALSVEYVVREGSSPRSRVLVVFPPHPLQ